MNTTPYAYWAISAVQPEHIVRKFEEADYEIERLKNQLLQVDELNEGALFKINEVTARAEKAEAEIETLKLELAAFKRNNEELIHRCNAAIASWDEERERALREAGRVTEWRNKCEDLVKCIRFIGKQIPCNTGGTFENDPPDAILDAAVRSLNESWEQEKEEMKLCHDKTLESLRCNVERAKVFEALAEMLCKADYDNIDASKKIYEAIREKYSVGTYYPPVNNK